MKLEIQYKEESLKDVMGYFWKGYPGDVKNCEWFIDAAKGIVVFKLYVNKPTKSKVSAEIPPTPPKV